MWLGGRDVTREIRSFDITTKTRYAADSPEVRARLVDLAAALAERVPTW